jgi:pimeloyl-ACP methyl ester carboxylesterase
MTRMYFIKPHLLARSLIISGIAIILLFACNKEKEEDLIIAEDIVFPVTSGGYLVQGTGCGEISLATLKVTLQLGGYPELNRYMKYPIKLYKIIYHTTYKGQRILASGLMVYPTSITDSIPSMIVGNGLVFADEDAPSSFSLPNNFTGFEFIASLGYFTLIPDMIGFGASKDLPFPIHNYEYSANAMIDFIYASKEFIEAAKLKVNRTKYLTGYSQGGYIAMATLKMIEEKPVTDITISATAVGAGGYNILSVLNDAFEKNTYSAPSHLIMLFSSYNEIYEWNRPMSDFFQEPYAGRIPELLDGDYNREEIDEQLAYSFDSLLTPTFIYNLNNNNEQALMEAFAENCVDDWAPKSPLNLIHSTNDDRIPLSTSEETYNKMISNGSESVIFTPIEAAGHIDSGVSFVETALQWFTSLNLEE